MTESNRRDPLVTEDSLLPGVQRLVMVTGPTGSGKFHHPEVLIAAMERKQGPVSIEFSPPIEYVFDDKPDGAGA